MTQISEINSKNEKTDAMQTNIIGYKSRKKRLKVLLVFSVLAYSIFLFVVAVIIVAFVLSNFELSADKASSLYK